MKKQSPDAAAIMALPAARHPAFTEFCRMLADHPALELSEAKRFIDTAVETSGMALDVEMLGAKILPFLPSARTSHEDQYKEAVGARVHQLIMRRP